AGARARQRLGASPGLQPAAYRRMADQPAGPDVGFGARFGLGFRLRVGRIEKALFRLHPDVIASPRSPRKATATAGTAAAVGKSSFAGTTVLRRARRASSRRGSGCGFAWGYGYGDWRGCRARGRLGRRARRRGPAGGRA